MRIFLYKKFIEKYKCAALNMIDEFSSKDYSIDRFLKENAAHFLKYGMAQTYIVLEDESDTIVAFFAISLVESSRFESIKLSNKIRKKLPKVHKKNKDEETKYFMMLLGQFAKNKNSKHSGVDVLEMILGYLSGICESINIRVIAVQCIKESKLVDFYKSCSFVEAGEEENLYNLIYEVDGIDI